MNLKDKYYLGYYDGEKLIALLDLIENYPSEKFVFIGFFMTDINVQNRGIGSNIIDELILYLKTNEYVGVRLAWIKGNIQAENFWIKNGFEIIKETSSNVAEVVVLSEKIL